MEKSLKILFFFGIAFALVFAVSSFGPAFVVQKKAVEGLQRQDIFYGDYSTSANRRVVIQEITVTNGYFLPRSFELPRVSACLYDSTGKMKGQSIGISYGSFVKTASPFSEPALGAVLSDSVSMRRIGYGYSSGPTYGAVELSANEKKTVQLLLDSRYYYGPKNDANAYNEILLIETEKGADNYDLCSRVGDEERANSIVIPLSGYYYSSSSQ